MICNPEMTGVINSEKLNVKFQLTRNFLLIFFWIFPIDLTRGQFLLEKEPSASYCAQRLRATNSSVTQKQNI